MSVSYSILPVGVYLNPEGRGWLERCEGLTLPPQIEPGRYPTPNELLAVLKQLTNHRVDCAQGVEGWDVDIVEQADPHVATRASLWLKHEVKDRPIEPDGPCDIYARRGSPDLLVLILHHLSQICGPFVLYCHAGGAILVMPEDTIPGSHWI